jgi:hypothetical protein
MVRAAAQEVVKYFGTLEANELTPIAGVDDAITAQKAELIDIVYDPKKAN